MKSGQTDQVDEVLANGDVVRRGDVMVAMRDGVRLATDVYLPARDGRPLPGRLPVLLHRTPYDKRSRRASEISAADRTPMLQADLACRLARGGYVVAFQDCRGRHRFGGRVHQVHRRGGGRLRYDRVAGSAAVGGRPRRHVRSLLLRPHADGGGVPGAARARRHDPRLRRLLRCLPGRHPAGRRLRAEAGDVGLQPRQGEPAREVRPRCRRRTRRRGHPVLVQGHAVERGQQSRCRCPGVRELLAGAVARGVLRR